ncbi:MAG: alkaline phosphatase family protein [Candidatus Eremiobacteraeota bacterium]|nr:alkaline phosphatase family protein [Candidatus Eremiobacteraeota bacterium]
MCSEVRRMFRPKLFRAVAAAVVGAIPFGLAVCAVTLPAAASAARVPRPAHTIVIVEENKTLAQIIGNGAAPFINALAKRGALFTDAHGVTHPSLPNYLALFAGVTNDNGDGCPATGMSPNAPSLASELLAAHFTFTGYAEALPAQGSSVCAAGTYARKHAPWTMFSNIPAADSKAFSAFPSYDALPTVAFVIPDVDDDMHDGTIGQGDGWLQAHLASLVRWADKHDSLVVLTWDEGYDAANSIPTILFGPMVRPGRYAEPINHYNVLRTLEDAYGLRPTGKASTARPLTCWR